MTTTDQSSNPQAASGAGAAALTTVQVHRVYINAPVQRVWDAIISPEWTIRYGYGGYIDLDPTPGTPWQTKPDEMMQQMGVTGAVVDGEVLEADPPRRLVQTWRMAMDPTMAAEGFTRLTYDLEEFGGVTKLTVTHDLTGAPQLSVMVGGLLDGTPEMGAGGWPWVLSDLKSLLETGTAFTRPA
jgi:uncharacterized protein YndB with AHSA1/START domain